MKFQLNLKAIALCPYRPLRTDDVSLKADDEVTILHVQKGIATVQKIDGQLGQVPVMFLDASELPGESFQDQIEYRHKWYSTVDGCSNAERFCPLTISTQRESEDIPINDCRPRFARVPEDITAKEGSKVTLEPLILSPTAFNVIWRGPAVEKRRAQIISNGFSTELCIESLRIEDAGPYSLVAENEFGISSAVIFITVKQRPDPPSNLTVKTIGERSIRLKWELSKSSGVKYAIEYKRPVMENFSCAASDLKASKVRMRHFRADEYRIRVFAYTIDFRSLSSNEIYLDFRNTFEDQKLPRKYLDFPRRDSTEALDRSESI